jgi:hypothetical protein
VHRRCRCHKKRDAQYDDGTGHGWMSVRCRLNAVVSGMPRLTDFNLRWTLSRRAGAAMRVPRRRENTRNY